MTATHYPVTLEYHGTPMAFQPTRVLCLQAHGPLEADEPEDADILELVTAGYSVFVQLEPGDGTRYGLLLSRTADGLSVMRIGDVGDGATTVIHGRPVGQLECSPLAPYNQWSRIFFAWWLNRLCALATEGAS